MDTKAPRASVILRTKNCESLIGQTLAALFSQDFRDFELIVVDSGSTDRTLDIVRRYPSTVVGMNPKEYLSGRALNLGASRAQSELLVFINSDTVPLVPDALRLLLSALDDPEVQAAFGRQVPRPDARSWVRHEVNTAFPDREDGVTFLVPFAAPFSVIRKSAWEEHPFFEEAWGSEDTEWGHWARTNNRKVRYITEARVMHSHNHNLRQLYGRLFTEGEALALILGGQDTILSTCRKAVGSIARDCAHAIRCARPFDLPSIPIRRLVCHWAYYRGHKLGEHRRATGSRDSSIGQEVILKRYDG
ncbi:MAG: glycosyltransferase family 2 protein [Candidatus Hydrogenedentes bacterium]|nr:glycosyltransferase family 2 protein [Candidatus Hydrogenedentota bacterium]